MPSWRSRILTVQSSYYVLTGVWPLLHFDSFDVGNGPKTDDWLVRMVALLVVLIGVTLGVAVLRNAVWTLEMTVLAAGATIAFPSIDIGYAFSGRISPIYLADGALEAVRLVGLVLTRRPRHDAERA